jgi:ferritin
MISEAMLEALTRQLNNEFYSSYVYLAMAAWLEDNSLRGVASWFRVQAQEELAHAMIVHNYLLDRDARITLRAIEQPQSEFKGLRDVFETALGHEREVTRNFNAIAALAGEERDFATSNFTRYFIDEQVEEEASFRDIIDQLKLVGDNGHAIFMLDKDLGTRVFELPPQLAPR